MKQSLKIGNKMRKDYRIFEGLRVAVLVTFTPSGPRKVTNMLKIIDYLHSASANKPARQAMKSPG